MEALKPKFSYERRYRGNAPVLVKFDRDGSAVEVNPIVAVPTSPRTDTYLRLAQQFAKLTA